MLQQGSGFDTLASKLEAEKPPRRSSFGDAGSVGAHLGSVSRRTRRSKTSSLGSESLKSGPQSSNHSPSKATPRRRRKKVDVSNLSIEALVSPRGRRVFKRDGLSSNDDHGPLVADQPQRKKSPSIDDSPKTPRSRRNRLSSPHRADSTSPGRRGSIRAPRSKRGSLGRSGHGIRSPSSSPQRPSQKDLAIKSPRRSSPGRLSPGRSPRRQSGISVSSKNIGDTSTRTKSEEFISLSNQTATMTVATSLSSDDLDGQRFWTGPYRRASTQCDNRRADTDSKTTRKVLDSSVQVLTAASRMSLSNSIAELFNSTENWEEELAVPKPGPIKRVVSKSHQMDIAAQAKNGSKRRASTGPILIPTGRRRSRSSSLSSNEGHRLDESPPPSKPSSMRRRSRSGSISSQNGDNLISPRKPASVRRRSRSSSLTSEDGAIEVSPPSKPSSMRRRSRSGSISSQNGNNLISPRKPASLRRRSRSSSLTSEDGAIEVSPRKPTSMRRRPNSRSLTPKPERI